MEKGKVCNSCANWMNEKKMLQRAIKNFFCINFAFNWGEQLKIKKSKSGAKNEIKNFWMLKKMCTHKM